MKSCNLDRDKIIELYTRNLMFNIPCDYIDLGNNFHCTYDIKDDCLCLIKSKFNRHLIIPNVIDKISHDMFYYSKSIHSIDLMNTSILEDRAFYGCLKLKKLIGNNIKCVYDDCFIYANIKELSLPNCTYIGKYAFAGCEKLRNVYLPNCECIDNFAFDFTGLRKLVIKKSCKITLYGIQYGKCNIIRI